MALEWFMVKKPTVLGFGTGAVVGLVTITPGAGFVTPVAAIFIGLIGSVICYFAVTVLKKKFGYDDALDAFGCHGIGGTWGGIAVGLFASNKVNPVAVLEDAQGLFYGGGFKLLGAQTIAIIATYAFAAVGTFLILMLIKHVFKLSLRTTEEEETMGLDASLHGETGYELAE